MLDSTSVTPPERSARPERQVHARSVAGAAPKGQQTKAAVVDAALNLASQVGLEGLSIGAVAELTHMSKSGVFAHFGSREELQISVVRAYHRRFELEVFRPTLTQPRGLPRLRALFANWVKRTTAEIDAGCLFISGATEFDDRPGPVRNALVESFRLWQAAIQHAIAQAKKAGHLRVEADEKQIVFEIHGLILALHYEARFLRLPDSIERAATGFETIIARHANSNAAIGPSSTAPSPHSPRRRITTAH